MDKLQLGVARENITPSLGGQLYGYDPYVTSERVEDELTVTAFYYKQNKTQALMLSVTVCLISTALANEILAGIEQSYGIPAKNCMISATHTHSGPNTNGQVGWGDIDRAYCDGVLIPAIMTAVKKAMDGACHVRMGKAVGESLVGINRRELKITNEVKLGQNRWGSFNPEMTVLSFIDDGGKTVANIIHYGAHGTAAGKNHEITRDWSGVMTDAVEKQSGGITAFFNGPEGDVGPRLSNGKTVGDITYVHELGNIAATDALRIYDGIGDYADVSLSVSFKELSLPLEKRMDRAEAERRLSEYSGKTVNYGAMIKAYLESVVESYQDGFVDKADCKVGQTVIALGDILFISFPYELFSEVGMRINDAIASKSVLSLSNTNGSEGYFITKDAICRGGYEVTMYQYGHLQQFGEDADYQLVCQSVEHIEKGN